MLTLELVKTEQQYEEVLTLVGRQTLTCLADYFDWIQLTAEQFGQFFRKTGLAFRICLDGHPVGLCWVEEVSSTVHLLGLIIQPAYQGQGLGGRTLERLEEIYAGRIEAIELIVHQSNPRAMALYQRSNFEVVNFCAETGFYTMRKTCTRKETPVSEPALKV
jgi:ribosomal protein S18 acetylase RimI-like enzyme